MPEILYDLHIHSCLSPCGEEEMTPGNIAGLCGLLGLQLVALTDHNTAKNCPAFFAACEKMSQTLGHPIVALAGMELTTAEEVHCVCLFERLQDALAFDAYVESRLPAVNNRPEIFGRQLLMDEEDHPIGEYDRLLINATTISISEVAELVRQYHGVAVPAHIEKPAYSVTANLGFFPEDGGFSAFEMADLTRLPEQLVLNPCLGHMRALSSSDAHMLEQLGSKNGSLQLSALSAGALLDWLQNK